MNRKQLLIATLALTTLVAGSAVGAKPCKGCHKVKDQKAQEQQRIKIEEQAKSLSLPMTGKAVPAFDVLDQDFNDLLKKWNIPGGQVAIARNGKIVFARGYGFANLGSKQPVEPDTLFRIASVSKAITSVAALRLIEQKKLKLTDKAFEILSDLQPCLPSQLGRPEKRLKRISIQHLLQSTAGWDRVHSGDPMFAPHVMAAAYNCSCTMRPEPLAVIRYCLEKPLDHDPGNSYAYSNLSYTVLEEIIKRKSGKSYEQYVQEEILQPIGITNMRLGRTLYRAPKETIYYPFPGQELAPSVFPNHKGFVPLPYGGDFALEALAGPAGWIASASDLVRFASVFAGEGKSPPLSKSTIDLMFRKPSIKHWEEKDEYFAMGWDVVPVDSKIKFSRAGSLPGNMAYVVHLPNGTTYAFTINSRPLRQSDFAEEAKTIIQNNIAKITTWPGAEVVR